MQSVVGVAMVPEAILEKLEPMQPCLGASSSVHYKRTINCKLRDSN